MKNMDILESLMHLPSISNAFLSPDGRQAAFTWQRRHPNLDVFAVSADGQALPFALTRTPHATRLVGWAPDSRSVVVAEDQDGDERVQLFRIWLGEPLKMTPLTEPHPRYYLRGGSLSADGLSLYYGANFDFERGELIEPTWVYQHDLVSGERIPLARPARPAWVEPALNLQGTRLFYPRRDRHPAGRQIHLVELANGGTEREIFNFGDELKVNARWFPDGERLAVVAETESRQGVRYERLGVYHIPSGLMCWLLDDPERTIQGAWVSRCGEVIVNEVSGTVRRPFLIDPVTGVETAFPDLGGNLLPLGQAADGAWMGLFYSAKSPEEIIRFIFMPGKAPEKQLLSHAFEGSDLTRGSLVPAEDFRWRSTDGLQVQGWLYRAVPNQKRAVLHIHGGPTSHAENRLYPQIQYLAARGFNVLSVNYRGSTGFGLTYRDKIREDGWGGREQDDISSGAQALLDAGLAAPGRIGITGTSYGGYSAWCQVTRVPRELIGAAVPICGMTDLKVDYETTRPDLRAYLVEMMGGTPDQLPEKYYLRSPLNFVEGIDARLLIVQGANDPNVTPENVRQVCARLDEQRIAYELLIFEDEGHGIQKTANQRLLYQKMADFFEAVLR